MHGVFGSRVAALGAIEDLMAPESLSEEQQELFLRIGQTQRSEGEGEWMTEEFTLNEISCRLQ